MRRQVRQHDRNLNVTLTQAAAAMGVTVSTLSRRRSLGHFPRFSKEPGGRCWLITISDLEAHVGPISDEALGFALRARPRKPQPAPRRFSERQVAEKLAARDEQWKAVVLKRFGQAVAPPI
jgi:hypothetical protein